MDIIVADGRRNGRSIQLQVKSDITLHALLMQNNQKRAALNLSFATAYTYNGMLLDVHDLGVKLKDFMAVGGDDSILCAIFDSVRNLQHDLSPAVLEEYENAKKNDSVELPSTLKKTLDNSLSFFPKVIADLVCEYKGDDSDCYLVVDMISIFRDIGKVGKFYMTQLSGADICWAEHFCSIAPLFFNRLFDTRLLSDGRIAIEIDISKFQTFRQDNEQAHFDEFKQAESSCRPLCPMFDDGLEHFDRFELIIHYKNKNVLGMYVNPYPSYVFKSLVYVNYSDLYLLPHQWEISENNLKASFAQHALKKMHQSICVIRWEWPDGTTQPVLLSGYTQARKCILLEQARDYFLEHHKSSSSTPWNKTHTLDDIFTHALHAKDGGYFATGGNTKRTILSLLNQNGEWFKQQTQDSLRAAFLEHVRLHYLANPIKPRLKK